MLTLEVTACDKDSTLPLLIGNDLITEERVVVNPTGYVPLAAEITLTTFRSVQIEIFIPGRRSASGNVGHRFK